MAYATVAQIEAMFPGVTFGDDTRVKASEVAEWIAEADQEVDSRVGLKYEVPVTGEKSLLILRGIAKRLVGEQVKAALEIKTESEQTSQSGQKPNMAKEARAMLLDIVEGRLLLPDATLLSQGGGVSSFNVDCEIEHKFKRGVEQW